jgi:hypothetical protein
VALHSACRARTAASVAKLGQVSQVTELELRQEHFQGSVDVRVSHPSQEREGWGTRSGVAGIERERLRVR